MRGRMRKVLGMPLSPREKQVRDLIAGGASNKDIAAALNLTLMTVRVYVRDVFRKLGVSSRLQIVAPAGNDARVLQARIDALKAALGPRGAYDCPRCEGSGLIRVFRIFGTVPYQDEPCVCRKRLMDALS